MFNTNTKLSLVEIIGLLAVGLFLFFQINLEKYGTRLQATSIFVLAVGGFIGILTYYTQIQDRAKMAGVQYSNITQSKINEIEKIFMMNPLLDRLYYQMNSSNKNLMKIKELTENKFSMSPEALKSEYHVANLIFQTIADIYACGFITMDDLINNKYNANSIEWVYTFREWLKSDILRDHWIYLQREHHPEARRLISVLISGDTRGDTHQFRL
jgi:hypothetical protein